MMQPATLSCSSETETYVKKNININEGEQWKSKALSVQLRG